MPIQPFISGIKTGIFLQLAIGPVFFYLVSIAVESNLFNSLMAVLAVTIVDYIYIGLSIIGIGTLLQKDQIKQRFGIFSSLVLVLFGAMILYKGIGHINSQGQARMFVWSAANSFASAFILTISSPLTIVFWSSIFSTKAIANNYRKQHLTMFGIGAGASTFLFLGIAVTLVSLLKTNIPEWLVQSMNCLVGLILIYYGVTRTFRFIRSNQRDS